MDRLRNCIITTSLLLLFAPAILAQPGWVWEAPWQVPGHGPNLGVRVNNLDFSRLDSLGLPYGVEITHVMNGSPAEAGGLRAGDIVLEVNKQPVFSVDRMRWLIRKAAPKTPIKLKYYRDGETSSTKIALHAPTPYPAPPPSWQSERVWSSPVYLGVRLQSLTTGLRAAFSVPDDVGVMISEVYQASAAARAGLRAGDVIVKMDRRTIKNIEDVQRVLDYFEPGEGLRLEIIRDKSRKQLEVVLGERNGPYGFGQWRRWLEPYYQNPPFFADPEWWREMQDFMKQWKRQWEEDRNKAPERSL